MLTLAASTWLIWVAGGLTLMCLITAFLVLRRAKKRESGTGGTGGA